MDSGGDFADFMWMADEDIDEFEREFERELLQEEIMWYELEEMLEEEEASGCVYYSDNILDGLQIDDDDSVEEDSLTADNVWSLNPEAPSFVPVRA